MLLVSAAADSQGATVVAWGDNSHSQTNVPSNLTNIVSVRGGTSHSLALDLAGMVVGWGDNANGETTPPDGLSDVTAIACGKGFSLAIQSDGTVAAWGTQTSTPSSLTNTIALDAADENALGLTRFGVAVPWGAVSSNPADATNLVSIAAGYTHDLGLQGNGAIVAWGDSSVGKTTVPPGLTDAIALAAGRFHSLALKRDGTVVAWGNNSYHQLEIPSGLSDVVAISAGGVHSLALKSDGTVVAWGDNTYHQLDIPPGLTNVVGISAGRYHNLAIVGDGSPVITVQPVCRYSRETGLAEFQVKAIGTAPLQYQWFLNGSAIDGATSPSLKLTNLSPADAGTDYSVIVSNALGSVESAHVTLPPAWQRPFILSQPVSDIRPCNDPATLQVDAGGTQPLSYQWYFGGAPLDGATNSILSYDHVTLAQTGDYTVSIANAHGAITSQVATLTVLEDPPFVTSPLTADGKQGDAFTYPITGLHNPTSFSAVGLPFGLSVDDTTGVIEGVPLEEGVFNVTIGTANLCGSASTNLMLTIATSRPTITSPLTATGAEQAPFSYQIAATESPTSFGAENLPQGLSVDPGTGVITGNPLYAGSYTATITASNDWGVGSAGLELTFSNAPLAGLAIANVTTNYLSPYLLDFQFALRDSDDPASAHAVVVDPQLLSVAAFEDDAPVSPSETAVIIRGGSSKVLKAFLVLDFSQSMASLSNGDTNQDGISDTVDAEISSAQEFVSVQPADAQIGVYEFHRDDFAPQQVASLTTDKTMVNEAIGGIWTNYVQDFPAGSRCWDGLVAAIGDLGDANLDEQHYVIFISDGKDESSTNTVDDVIEAATNSNVKVYCIGFGAELDATTLQSITSQTLGRYYEATNAASLASEMAQIGKDLSGQYILRWATLKRTSEPFDPTFQISYQGLTAVSPPNPPPTIVGTNTVVDDTTDPPTTNDVPIYETNYIISPYTPSDYAGDVTIGSLRLVPNADVNPVGIDLRATYVPRYVRQIQLHYRANWPCVVSLQSTNVGEMLYGWTLTQTNVDAGESRLLLSAPDPTNITNSMQFASFGRLLTFTFRDNLDASNAFSIFDVDNTIYTNMGNQSFTFENTDSFVKEYPILTNGTPVPWLEAHGFTSNFDQAELSNPDGDGLLTWQEYQANTDPNDGSSTLAVSVPTLTGSFNRYEVHVTTALNRTYRVEVSSNLVDWETLQDGIAGTGGDVAVADTRYSPDSSPVYYRAVVY